MYRYASKHVWRKGFTLVELLVALTVSSIVLGAVGTLAFAMGAANKSLEQANKAQVYSRFSTLLLRDTLRYARQAFVTPDGNIALWKADNNSDGWIDGSELIFFRVAGQDLHLHEFAFTDPEVAPVFTIAEIEDGTAYSELSQLASNSTNVDNRQTLPDCPEDTFTISEVTFTILDPPANKYLNLTYKLTENGVATKYQVNTRLRCSADNLIDYIAGTIVQDDDY